MSVKNASVLPKRYFGLHMVEGVAEYREPEQSPYRIFIGENAIKNMDPTFDGKPVYVRHVDEVDVANLHNEADGYVVRSFFNQHDGKHWVEFLVVSDRGHEAIRNGWKLSNAYVPKEFAGGGEWHGVDYIKEVMKGEYEHLAIVPNPRYQESVIMTPEQFKNYNGEKELELKRLANSKEKGEPMFKIFKKTKVENQADLEGMTVVLPKSGIEMTVTQLVEHADKAQETLKNGYMCNGDETVKVGEDQMSVNQLLEKHMNMSKELEGLKGAGKKDNAEPTEEEKKKNAEKEEADKKAADEKKANEDKAAAEAEEKKKNEEKAAEEEKKKNALHFDALKNAPFTAVKDTVTVDLPENKVARGQNRYGSGK